MFYDYMSGFLYVHTSILAIYKIPFMKQKNLVYPEPYPLQFKDF